VKKRRPGFSAVLSNATVDYMAAKPSLCFKDSSDNGDSLASITMANCAGIARYLTLFNQRNETLPNWSQYPNLEIAEVEIYQDGTILEIFLKQ